MARIFKPSTKKSAARQEPTPERLTIETLAAEGRGIARHQGKTVFVGGALVGEEVTVKHYRRSSSYSECQVKSLITQSPLRVEPPCAIYNECGGCQLQHLEPTQQLLHKQQSLVSKLQHQLGGADFKLEDPAKSSAQGYRSRVRFVINGQQQLCFRAQGSDKLVEVSQCLVLDPRLQDVLVPLQNWLVSLPPRSGISHVELTVAAEDVGLVIRHLKPLSPVALDGLQSLEQQTLLRCWLQSEKRGSLIDLKGQGCDPRLNYSIGEQEILFHPSDFTQVNRQVNQSMVDQALLWLAPKTDETIVDLFCGIGNFTLPIASSAGRVVGVEAIDSMVQRGRENAQHNGLSNVEFRTLDLNSHELSRDLQALGADKLLIDPPRAGAKFVCQNLCPETVSKLVYVSCNPASLARDAVILLQRGFQLKAVKVLDMFPHTAHVEAMALFEN